MLCSWIIKKILDVNCRPGHDNNTVDFTCVYSYSFLLYLFRKVNEKLSELKVILLTVKVHNIVGYGTGNSSNDNNSAVVVVLM